MMVEHGNVATTLAVYQDRLGITARDRLSCIELWPALAPGAQLHVVAR
jgi:hypothetical protein